MTAEENGEADAYYFQAKRQLEWAPALANGTAVIAMANIVANASNQDAALAALTVPLALFGAGLFSAISALHCSFNMFQHMSYFSKTAQELSSKANPLIEAFNTSEGEAKVNALNALLKVKPRIVDEQPRLKKALRLFRLYRPWVNAFSVLAIGLCGAGFLALLVGHYVGWIVLSKP